MVGVGFRCLARSPAILDQHPDFIDPRDYQFDRKRYRGEDLVAFTCRERSRKDKAGMVEFCDDVGPLGDKTPCREGFG